jgi:hypothetical protein
MSPVLTQTTDDLQQPDRALILKYTSEDDQSFIVSNPFGTALSVPKNRNVPQPFPDRPTQPLTPAFRLLALAFIGLAPAGLGTLALAPLAALWALAMLITRPLTPQDQKRVIVIWGIAIGMMGIAIPMSRLFLVRLSP